MKTSNKFMFIRISGDSMSPKIEDGDELIIEKQNYAESGDIAVVIVDGETLIREVVYKDNKTELHSLNSSDVLRIIDTEARYSVIGRVMQIARKV